MPSRRGFTLIELLVALVLFLIVSAAIYGLLNNTQRVSRAQAERVDMQSNMRAGALIVPSDLKMIGYDSVPGNATVTSDIVAMGSDSIMFRAIRASGIVCKFSAANTIVIDTSATHYYSAYRQPVSGGRDLLMLFFDGDSTTSSDDQWGSGLPITSVGTSGSTCTAAYGSRPGFQLGTTVAYTGTSADALKLGAPFRTYEIMVYRLYQSGSKYYLGARSSSNGENSFQPVLGPLSSSGFRLDYYDSTGTTVTSVPKNVRSIQVTLIGQSDQAINGAGGGTQSVKNDSVVTRVTLRNALR
jgi:prepilin-type N-terminal cleavage/methylation domain-containing protein